MFRYAELVQKWALEAAALLTLLCLGPEGFVQEVCDLVKDICLDILLCVLVYQHHLHRPVPQWVSFYARVGIGTVKPSALLAMSSL